MPFDPHVSPAAPRLLEVSHVAHRLSASQDFVRRLIRDGKLAAIRLETRWRIDPRDLEAYIEARREASARATADHRPRLHPLPDGRDRRRQPRDEADDATDARLA